MGVPVLDDVSCFLNSLSGQSRKQGLRRTNGLDGMIANRFTARAWPHKSTAHHHGVNNRLTHRL